MPQKIQPMGLVGSHEAISAPTAGYASDSTPVSTAKPGSYLNPPTSRGNSSVVKSSTRVSVMSTTHTANTNHANQAEARWLIGLTPRPCFLAPSVTTALYSTTVSQALRQTLRSRRSRVNFREFLFHAIG